VDPARVTRNSRLRDEFGIDSSAMIDVVSAVEDAFGITIPDEDAERFQTVGAMADFLEKARTVA